MGLWHPDTIDGQIAHQIAACDRCQADRRPRMFVCDYHEGWIAALDGLTPPPGETWRVTVHDDGTVERVRLDPEDFLNVDATDDGCLYDRHGERVWSGGGLLVLVDAPEQDGDR